MSSLAGKNVANPVAMILCVALMFRYSFNMEREARIIETAVSEILEAGIRTPDLGGKAGTDQVGDAVVEKIKQVLA
jgi:3-isopropylmalate dehydrogenase